MASGYRELPHTADLALEVWGQDLPELFAHAAEGLVNLALSVEPGAPVSARRQVDLNAPDWEALLVDWLNEILALQDEHGEGYVTFDLSLPRPYELAAHIGGTQACEPRRTIKAATFHGLAIRQGPEGWHAIVVFDV